MSLNNNKSDTKDALYGLIISQLLHDGHQDIAMMLQKKEGMKKFSLPSDKLLNIVDHHLSNPDGLDKVKCRNFLATLLRLASEQPENVAKNVRELIQGLIDSRIEPEVFTTKLQKELNSSPQPCLVPFLKKSLPYLQHSLATMELTIEGVIPPAMSQVNK